MAKTTFAEEVYLRALTGKVVGESILGGYNKVAFVSVKNTICSAISAAAEAAFVMTSKGRATHLIVEGDNAPQVANSVKEFDPEAVILMFGGETPIEETKKLFVDILKALSKADIDADLILHVRIFAAGGLDLALKDADVEEYLTNSDVYVYTVDLDKGLVVYNSIYFEEKPELERLGEIPITAEHADLLNRSLRDKTLAWE
jgi:hypothetical protein